MEIAIKNMNHVTDIDTRDLREEFTTKNVKTEEMREKSKVKNFK